MLVSCTLAVAFCVGAPAEDLSCLPSATGVPAAGGLLYDHLLRQAHAAIDRRAAAYEQLKTPEQIRAYQVRQRATFLRLLGEFPPRTPLNARTVKTLDGPDYRVENVMFESQPGHHVTANLYVPKGRGPFPGVIVPCGHSHTGKAAEAYQRVSILLAKHGIAAFCYDPIGQGERYQMYGRGVEKIENPASRPNSKKILADIPGQPHFDSVEEHTLIGVGSILLGTNTAKFRIWDGMRAIDYLQSRPDIDPARIGCTGNSGGGTLTAYLMALDERIVCAAPACYLTTFRKLLDTSGPQDAEQNLFSQIEVGLDEADYVLLRAPKPTRLLAGTRDATFDITGTWDVFREGKRIFTRLEASERVDLLESDAPHGFTVQLREGATQWMKRWLVGRDEAIVEPEFPAWTLADLQCTPQGQVMMLDGQRSVFDLHREAERRLAESRAAAWKQRTPDENRAVVRRVIGVAPAAEVPEFAARRVGMVARDGYRVERLVLSAPERLPVPALAFVPDRPTESAVLWLSDRGKQADAAPGGELEKLARAGKLVLAVDLCGFGETEGKRARDWSRGLFGPNGQEFFVAYLLGRSLVALRTEETWGAARVAASFADGKNRAVEVIASGDAGLPALHAVALEPARFGRLVVRQSLASWSSVIQAPLPNEHLTNTVHGALATYDLPDLAGLIGAERLKRE